MEEDARNTNHVDRATEGIPDARDARDSAHSGDANDTSGAPRISPRDALLHTMRADANRALGSRADADSALSDVLPRRSRTSASRAGDTVSSADTHATASARPKGIIRTFKGDVRSLVRDRKVSLVTMAAMEGDRKHAPAPPVRAASESSWRATTVFALAGLFVAVGAVVMLGVYYAQTARTQQANDTLLSLPSIIFTESREFVDTTDRTPKVLLRTLSRARRGTLFSLGSVVDIVLTRAVPMENGEGVRHVPLRADEFMRAIEARVPEAFVKTLDGAFMLGIHAIDDNPPFLILRTRSYEHAFSGMLAWEPLIEEDLSPLFSPGAEYVVPAASEGKNGFTDHVVNNLDVRIIRDASKNIRILYAFVDRRTIVITTDLRTLVEISSRLQVR